MKPISRPDRFEHYCTCGGYAFSMNGRSKEQPHMDWCPQYEEWEMFVAKGWMPWAGKEEFEAAQD